MENELSGRFKNDAKQIVDTLFETKYFIDDITRDQMDSIESLVEFMIDSRFESYVRAYHLGQRMIEIQDKKD